MSTCSIPSCRGNRRKQDSGEESDSSRKESRSKQTTASKDTRAASARGRSDRHGSQTDSARRESQAGSATGGSQSDSIRRGSRSTAKGSQDIAVGGTEAHSVSSGAPGDDICIPAQTTFSDTLILVRRNFKKTVNNAYAFWKKVREDRFRWQLFKSVLFFTLGLKLFDDLKRHMAEVAKGPAKVAGVRALGRGAKAAANCKRSLS